MNDADDTQGVHSSEGQLRRNIRRKHENKAL